MSFLEPDVIGYRKEKYGEKLVIVEVKADPMYLFDGIGRCRIFQLTSNYVYLALPSHLADKIGTKSLYEDLGIGVLSVDKYGVVEVKVEAKESHPYSTPIRDLFLAMVRSALGIT